MTGRHLLATRAAGLALGLVILAACSAAHPPLALNNDTVSDCFRALPVAKSAVHEQSARFIGVMRGAADHIQSELPGSAVPPDDDTEVCALAFRGSFSAGQVDGAPSAEVGPYAVVIVTSRKLMLLQSFVGAQLPIRFTHHLV
jgi:hypothetical protein